MILVNFPGNGDNVYAPLNHTHWNGITPTDLIAPFFLFIVGVAIAFAYTKRLDAGISPSKMYPKLIWKISENICCGNVPEYSWACFPILILPISGIPEHSTG